MRFTLWDNRTDSTGDNSGLNGTYKKVNTKLGTFSIHRISPILLMGLTGIGQASFLIAEPEKALFDSIYLSTRKKKQFGYFPELYFPKSFSFKKVAAWIDKIPEKRIRSLVDKN